jgi:TetR/AcrR family transcriptional regulator
VPASTRSATGRTRRSGTRGPANAEAILAAAHRLVAEHGDDFTTQDLIREADVALQTFYRHFGSKDQLLVAVIAEQIAGHCDALTARAASLDDPVDRLHLYITETIATLADVRGTGGARFITSQHWRLHQLLPEALAEATKPYADLLQRDLEAAQAAGALAPRSPERSAWLITRFVITVFHHYAFIDRGVDVADLAEEVWEFCLAAVAGQQVRGQRGRPAGSNSRWSSDRPRRTQVGS